MYTEVNPVSHGELRHESQRRCPPDRGIVLLEAKDRIGPMIWALYGKVDKPTVLKDDLYVDNALNDFYRDSNGFPFLLLPFVSAAAANRFEVADAAYRRAVALGVIERPEIFFTCVYQFQLPEYRCLHIHADRGAEVLEEEKCLRLMNFEKLRLLDEMGETHFTLRTETKLFPVEVHCQHADAEPSMNLQFALNTLVIHHGYNAEQLASAWHRRHPFP